MFLYAATPCPKPLLTYGNSNCTDGSKIYSSCQHQCSEGYKLERGRASSTCEMKNGSSVWVPELPTCESERKYCSLLTDFHISLSYQKKSNKANFLPNKLTHTTDSSSDLIFSNSKRIILTGNLDNLFVYLVVLYKFCILVVSCPRATVFNGTSNCSAFNKLGSKCKHYCERGFQLNGASLTTCIVSNESPMWSPELPNCKGR